MSHRPALAMAMICLAACGGTNKPDAGAKQAEPKYFRVQPEKAGVVSGTISFRGKAPRPVRISMEAEEDCVKLHPKPVFDEPVITGKDGGLANALVYIKKGLEGKTFAPSPAAVVIDQRGCQFVPRVVAVRKGEMFRVKNSDPVSHNIHPMPQNNRDWNQQQSPGAPDLQRRFGFAEVMIPVKCNVHQWMKSYIGVLDHPYFQVTEASGAYRLEALPAGDYTLAVWHEMLGEMEAAVTVAPGGAVTRDFVLKTP